jgi:hypothetical protein
MKCNVGKTDRGIRLFLAVLVAMAGLYYGNWWGLLAILPLVTSYLGFCPVYKLFGISTCSTRANVS